MKKKILILLPLLLIVGAGVTVGLDVAGVVNVPFLPFGKKKVKPPVDDGKGGPLAPLFASAASVAKQAADAAAKEAAAPPPPTPKPVVDPGPGESKLAALWAAMPTDQVAALIAKWPQDQLGRILAKMDEDATAKLLAAVPPAQAASLSRALAQATNDAAQSAKKDSQ